MYSCHATCCILSKFYIKPQLLFFVVSIRHVVSYRNSTSNHNCRLLLWLLHSVVSYRNSTSNHNDCSGWGTGSWVVSYRNSTSNHNKTLKFIYLWKLYLIEILHQTTTFWTIPESGFRLYLIEILHQTTTSGLILIDKVLLTGCLPL